MGLFEKMRRAILKPVIFLPVIMVLVLVGWFVYKNITGYGYRELTIDDTIYSFNFQKSAKTTIIQGAKYLVGSDLKGSNTILVTANKSLISGECTSAGAKAQFHVDIEGTNYPVCTNSAKQIYVARFQHDNTWHFVTVLSKDQNTTPDQATMVSIISSLKVQ